MCMQAYTCREMQHWVSKASFNQTCRQLSRILLISLMVCARFQLCIAQQSKFCRFCELEAEVKKLEAPFRVLLSSLGFIFLEPESLRNARARALPSLGRCGPPAGQLPVDVGLPPSSAGLFARPPPLRPGGRARSRRRGKEGEVTQSRVLPGSVSKMAIFPGESPGSRSTDPAKHSHPRNSPSLQLGARD